MKKSFFQLVTGRDPEIEQYKNILNVQPDNQAKNAQRSKSAWPNKKETEIDIATEDELNENEALAEEGQLTIDVYQTADEMVIKSTIAGVRSDDLDITIANDMVTIQGNRRKDENVSPEDYYYQELYWGQFSRTVILPQEVDTESAKASLKDGVLTIRLPKFERGRSKKLRINSV